MANQSSQYTNKFLQRRKFYTALPLLVLPFLTLIFWALFKPKLYEDQLGQKEHKGLILSLPDAFFQDDRSLDKLGYYQKAEKDSAKLRELIKKDPYYQDTSLAANNSILGVPLKSLDGPGNRKTTSEIPDKPFSDANEQNIQQKLSELNKVLSQAPDPKFSDSKTVKRPIDMERTNSTEMENLKHLMDNLQDETDQTESDPEMQQLSGMLDKILDIQHPERTSEKIKEQSQNSRGQVFAVSRAEEITPISLLESSNTSFDTGDSLMRKTTWLKLAQTGSFYSLNNKNLEVFSQNAIEAVVHESQTLVVGATLKFRLLNDVYTNGVLIPKGNFMFGTVTLNNERLDVQIESIRFNNSLFPVNLSVYDMDGQQGIYIPGAIERVVGKQQTNRDIQSLSLPIMDPSLGAQAASAGIQAAKTLIGRKVKLTQVTVKAGYQVLLYDGNSKAL